MITAFLMGIVRGAVRPDLAPLGPALQGVTSGQESLERRLEEQTQALRGVRKAAVGVEEATRHLENARILLARAAAEVSELAGRNDPGLAALDVARDQRAWFASRTLVPALRAFTTVLAEVHDARALERAVERVRSARARFQTHEEALGRSLERHGFRFVPSYLLPFDEGRQQVDIVETEGASELWSAIACEEPGNPDVRSFDAAINSAIVVHEFAPVVERRDRDGHWRLWAKGRVGVVRITPSEEGHRRRDTAKDSSQDEGEGVR